MRINRGFIYIFFFLVSHIGLAQEWTLKLTSKIEKDGKGIGGASIILYKGSSIVAQTQSSGNGDFQINVPANGDYIMTVSYPGCNTKKFQVSTMGVPAELINDKFKAEVKIEGVTMSKPLPGINYSVLNQPLLKLGYNASKKTFNDDPSYTNQTLNALASIRAQEEELISKYNAALKSGDSFLAKKDCDNAKAQYTTANKILPDEGTPLEKLLLAENCIKAKAEEEAKKKAEAEAAAKKAEEERIAKEKEAAAKAEAERIAQEKAAAEKLAKEQAAAKKAEEERIAKEKEAAAKAEAERIAQEKAAAEKLAKEQEAAQKAALAKAAAERKEKERLEKIAKEKEIAEKKAQEKAAAEKLAQEKAAAAKKAEEERIAKEKANTEKLNAETSKNQEGIIAPVNSGSELERSSIGSKDAKYSSLQTIGSQTQYLEKIKRGNELFKMKRYAEAKPVYEEALKFKPNDPTATKRLEEIEALLKK